MAKKPVRQTERERNIAQYEVEDTIRHPDSRVPQSWGPIKAEKQIGQRIVTVIYEDKGNEKVVVTVWPCDVV